MSTVKLPVRRARASTIEIQPPRPESKIEAYGPERVQEGLDYASHRLQSKKRKPTPNTQRLLILYHGACKQYLENFTKQSSDENACTLDEIRGYEVDMSYRGWITDVPSSVNAKAFMALRRMTYLARYGDYTKVMATKLRTASQSAPRINNWTEISGQHVWTEISDRLKEEAPIWKKDKALNPELVKTTRAVADACYRIGITLDNMIHIINTYGERNETFHSQLESWLETEQYPRVASMIHDDLLDLASICPVEESENEEAMRALLEALRDEWFDTSRDIANPGTWRYKAAITATHDDKKERTEKAEAWRMHVAEKAAKRLDLAEEDLELIIQAAAPWTSMLCSPRDQLLPKRAVKERRDKQADLR